MGSATELEKAEPLQESMARVPVGSLEERRGYWWGGRRDSSEVRRASGRFEMGWEGGSTYVCGRKGRSKGEV